MRCRFIAYRFTSLINGALSHKVTYKITIYKKNRYAPGIQKCSLPSVFGVFGGRRTVCGEKRRVKRFFPAVFRKLPAEEGGERGGREARNFGERSRIRYGGKNRYRQAKQEVRERRQASRGRTRTNDLFRKSSLSGQPFSEHFPPPGSDIPILLPPTRELCPAAIVSKGKVTSKIFGNSEFSLYLCFCYQIRVPAFSEVGILIFLFLAYGKRDYLPHGRGI